MEQFSEKKITKAIVVVFFITVLIVAIGVAVFIYQRIPKSVSECKDVSCIEKFVLSENFTPNECKKITLRSLRDQCYFIYETQNEKAKKSPGDFCGKIDDRELESECFYKTRKVVVMTPNLRASFNKIVSELEPEKCSTLKYPELQKECKDIIMFIKEAIDKKDVSLCYSESKKIAEPARWMCEALARKALKEKEE